MSIPNSKEKPANPPGKPTPEYPFPADENAPMSQILSEYEQSIATWPESAELRLQYGWGLYFSDRPAEAREQVETAIRLRPEWNEPHLALAAYLQEAGENEAALIENQEAIRLLSQGGDKQGEAVARWGMAETLKALGRIPEAQHQLEQAVSLQQAGVNEGQGSEQLLGQLTEALAQMERE